MQSDKELLMLEQAAKALGGHYIDPYKSPDIGVGYLNIMQRTDAGVEYGPPLFFAPWRPHQDDGDCARLEAACEIEIEWCRFGVIAKRLSPTTTRHDINVRVLYSDHGGDKNKARRYVSTRAAAQLAQAAQSVATQAKEQ